MTRPVKKSRTRLNLDDNGQRSMDEPASRRWTIFFEVYEPLPRQGPGNRASAERALELCRDLPDEPTVLDLGCGAGGQTLHLAALTRGSIVALDSHAPSIERLRATVEAEGLGERVRPMVGDMADPGLPEASLDLVWSEGALYNIGLERGLAVCRALLRAGGYVAFTDAVWRKDDPPREIAAGFEQDYPTMGKVADALAVIDAAGLSVVGHFTLPDEAWWDDFYTPMLQRIEVLRRKYAGDTEALAVLDEIANEPEMHRRYSDWYAYEFFVAQR